MYYNKIEDVTAPNKNFGKQKPFHSEKRGKGEGKNTMETDNFHVLELFKRINDTIEKNANSNLQSYNITLSQVKMLFTILNAESSPKKGVIPLKELERRFGVAQSTAAGIIQRLEKKGLVENVADAEDKRVKVLITTDKGKSICESAVRSMMKQNEKALCGFDGNERSELERLLRKLLKNIE